MTSQARVAAVIVTYNSADVLGDCLRSLSDQGAPLAAVVVADNASRDETRDIAEEFADLPMQVVDLGRNAGYSAALNAGIRALDLTRLDAVLALNPDSGCCPARCSVLASALCQPGRGIAVPRLVNPDGSLQPSLRRKPTVGRALVEALLPGALAGRLGPLGELVTDPAAYERPGVTAWATGAAMLLSVSAWREIGPWDESFLLYSEETEYSLRAADKGWQTWYEPAAVFEHSGGDSSTNPSARRTADGQPCGVVPKPAQPAALGGLLRRSRGWRVHPCGHRPPHVARLDHGAGAALPPGKSASRVHSGIRGACRGAGEVTRAATNPLPGVHQAIPSRTMDIEPVDRARWTELARGFADHNFRQCWDFGIQTASRVGAKSEHVALRQAGEVVAIADVRVRKLPVVGGGLAYVTGGPLTRKDGRFDPARYVDAVAALRRRYVEERGCVLRILPPVGPPEWNAALNAGLANAGFESTDAMPTHRTLLLPVGGDLAEIRKRFHQKWRNHLNRSEREHIEVRVGSDTAFLDRFAALFEEFVVRKGFHVDLGVDFYQRVDCELPEHERYVVLLAEREGQLLAGHLTTMLGDTCVSLLAATSPEALKCKAAYLIQWRTIESARERGCVSYDQGGIHPEGNPGVYSFKVGLAGTDVRAAGPLQAVGGLRGKMTLALEARIRGRN